MLGISAPTDPRSDLDLLDAAKNGDVAARETLFARFEGVVYRFGLHLCRDSEDAREVLQDTLLAAARTLSTFRGDAAVGTWLFTIARSFCIKRRRRRGREAQHAPVGRARDGDQPDEIDLCGVADAAAAPDEAAMSAANRRALEQAINPSLPQAGRCSCCATSKA